MKQDAIELEEGRLQGVEDLSDYRIFKERHRVFPAVFERRQHCRILDMAAGVGCAAERIHAHYPADLVCNDISPTCLKVLGKLGLQTVSFDLDDPETPYPFPGGDFDAVISLVTIEHIFHVEHLLQETYRILKDGGYLYIATPNYSAPEYLVQPLLFGRTFHDPLVEDSRYEFYAHIRYLTYRTLIDLLRASGFVPDTVYLALPAGSTRYKALYAASSIKALGYRYARWLEFHLLPVHWAAEPIVCCQKTTTGKDRRLRRVVL